MSVDRISLDANILFYAIDVDAGERHERAKEIVTRSAKDFTCILALQALAEFFASATRKGKLTSAEAAEQVEDWQVLFPVVAAKPENLHDAIRTVEIHNLSFWDAMPSRRPPRALETAVKALAYRPRTSANTIRTRASSLERGTRTRGIGDENVIRRSRPAGRREGADRP